MSDWREFEISNFEGIATSNRTPRKTQCQECKNFDLRNVLGDLQLREGFSQKSDIPLAPDYRSKLSNITFLGFENLYVPDGGGKEITIWIAKGTLAGENENNQDPVGIRNILLLFSSHQFNGTSWVQTNWDGSTTGMYWLNHTIVTRAHTFGSEPNQNQITLDCDSSGLVGKLNNWTMINISKTPYQVLKVIYSADNGSGKLLVHSSAKYHNWAANDEIVLMRNYIPYDELLGMYNTTADQVSIYKINDDLRIGLGSGPNKLGLSIGYRKNYLRLNNIDFPATSGNYTSYLEAFSTTNNIVVDVYNGTQQDVRLDIDVVSTNGSIAPPANYYYFKVIGVLDNYQRVYLNEAKVTWSTGNMNLQINVEIKLGQENHRLTNIEIYFSSDDKLYYYVKNIQIKDTNYFTKDFRLNTNGYLVPVTSLTTIMTGSDATRPAPYDESTVGTWEAADGDDLVTIAAVTATPTPQDGTYSLKITHSHSSAWNVGAFYPVSLKQAQNYSFDFYVYMSAAQRLSVNFVYSDGYENNAFYIDGSVIGSGSWYHVEKTIKTPGTPSKTTNIIGFTVRSKFANTEFMALDNFQLMIQSTTFNFSQYDIDNANDEMYDKIGFDITQPMVRSWDDAVVTRGRTFLVNPYIDIKYTNKIFSSFISGAGSYQYDAITLERYIDLENFDGNDLIGLEVLPNMNFLAFRKNSIQQVDPDTGATREIIYGNGVVARKSIVNFGDKIVWCGINDIMATDGLNTVSLTDGTIREDYRALTNKTGIVAVREERDNAYRFFTGDTTNRTEYILTKRGWIKRVNSGDIYPIHYAISRDSYVCFMDLTGMIYVDSGAITDTKFIPGEGIPGIIIYPMAGTWQSIDFDIDLLGENLTETDFFTLRSMWLDYTGTYSEGTFTINIYIDGVSLPAITLDSKNQREKLVIPIPLANRKPARRFSIKITVGGAYLPGSAITIHSVGVLWKPIRSGRFN